MQVKKQQLEPDMEQWTGSKLGKEYVKPVCCNLAYLTCTQNAGLDEAQADNESIKMTTLWFLFRKGKQMSTFLLSYGSLLY